MLANKSMGAVARIQDGPECVLYVPVNEQGLHGSSRLPTGYHACDLHLSLLNK